MYRPTVPGDKRLLFVLVAAFLLLAPASVSGSASSALKWGRVGVLVAAFLVGLKWFRVPSFSELSGKVLLLATVFCVASVWSTSPLWGLVFKGMFVCGVCASISLARCLSNESEFRVFSRTMTVATWIGILLAGYLIFGVGDYVIWKGRLVLADVNANTLGLSAAIFALLCLFHLMVKDTVGWRALAWSAIGVMSVLIVYSGSRAAVLTLVSGVALLLPALAKTRKNMIVLGVLGATSLTAVAVIWFGLTDDTSVDVFGVTEGRQATDSLRIVEELTKDTRMKIWTSIVSKWGRDDLAIGAGWLHRGNQWNLVQSAYLQVVAETGLIGITVVIMFFFSGIRTVFKSIRRARQSQGFSSLMLYLFSATFFAVAFHGVFESSMVVGTTPNSILLGFSAAQLDLQLRAAPALTPVQRMRPRRQIPRMHSRSV